MKQGGPADVMVRRILLRGNWRLSTLAIPTPSFTSPARTGLFHSRAVIFCDHYQVRAEETGLSDCYPSDPRGDDVAAELLDSSFCSEFDRMAQGIVGLETSKASLTANPGGEFVYRAWSQALPDGGELVESDAMARRMR